MQITWGWDLVLILALLAFIVCLFSFDMINRWEQKRRDDLNLLLIGVAVYSLLIVLASDLETPAKIVLSSSLIVLAVMGHVASTTEFSGGADNTLSSGDKPWELWFVAFFTLAVLVGCAMWTYFYTDLGRSAQRSASKLSSKLQGYRMPKGRSRPKSNAMEMTQF